MIKIIEIQQQFGEPKNNQSRIIEFDSFQDYLKNVDNSLPNGSEIYKKHIDENEEKISMIFEVNYNGVWLEFTHFGQAVKL